MKKCPFCSSNRVAKILWGMPAFSEELERDVSEGKVVFDGCCVSEGAPSYRCLSCGKDIFDKETLCDFHGESIDRLISDVVNSFDVQEANNEACVSQVIEAFPSQTDPVDVLIKVRMINLVYGTRLKEFNDETTMSVHSMAKHIISLNVTDKLKAGDISLVSDIGNTDENHRDAFSFASKYCSWHEPTKFPIMDQFTRGVLYYWAKVKGLKYTQKDVNDYCKYKGLLDKFIDTYKLNYSYKEIDKFLWKYGKEHHISYDEKEIIRLWGVKKL